MKSFLVLLAAALSVPSLAFAEVKEADLPNVFKNEPPYMQNQICGELMADMTRMSAALYKSTNRPAMQEAAIMAGTRAIVFVKANAALSADEKQRARKIADQLDKQSASKPSDRPVRFCEERVARWLKEGVITPADMKQTEAEVRKVVLAGSLN